MTAPSVVRLMAQRIPVKRVRELIHEDDGEKFEAWGLWDADKQTIFIRNGQALERERTTFMHENLHAMVSFGGLSSCSSEEQLVTSLAPILICWMRENPRAVAFLMEKS